MTSGSRGSFEGVRLQGKYKYFFVNDSVGGISMIVFQSHHSQGKCRGCTKVFVQFVCRVLVKSWDDSRDISRPSHSIKKH